MTTVYYAFDVDNGSVLDKITFADGAKNLFTPDLVISVPTLFGNARIAFETIQQACDHFASRHTLNATILVAPGSYRENLNISRQTSSVTLNNVTPKTIMSGLTIIGDSRNYVGLSYVENGINSNPTADPEFGPAYGPVSLVSVGQGVQVVAGQNFEKMGVVAKDVIKIRDPSGVWYTRIVEKVTPDTLYYDGSPVNIGAGSAVVMCPNVEILSSDPTKPIFYNSACPCSIVGMWLNSDKDRGSETAVGMLVCYSTTILARGIVLDNAAKRSRESIIDSTTMFVESYDVTAGSIDGLITVIGSIAVKNARLCHGYVSVFDHMHCINANAGSFIGPISLLQAVNTTLRMTQSRGSIERIYSTLTHVCLDITSSTLQIGNIDVQSRLDCKDPDNKIPFADSIAIKCATSQLRMIGSILIADTNTGLLLHENSSCVMVAPSLTFDRVSTNIVTENMSSWNGMSDPTTPGNVYTYTTQEPEAQNAYSHQIITQKQTVTFDSTAETNGVMRFLGKTFTVASLQAAGSACELLGANWATDAFGTLAQFDSDDSVIVFTIESTKTARVLYRYKITFA